MKWINLKNNKCPQCNKDFMMGLVSFHKETGLMIHKCGFKISEQRYKEIVSGMVENSLTMSQE